MDISIIALTIGHIWPWASRKPKQIKETQKMCPDLNLYTVILAKNECMTMSLSWKSFSKHYKWTTIQPLSLPPPFHHLLPSLPTMPAVPRGPASPALSARVWSDEGACPSHTRALINPHHSQYHLLTAPSAPLCPVPPGLHTLCYPDTRNKPLLWTLSTWAVIVWVCA